MQHSKLLACAALALAVSVVIVEASRHYNNGPAYNQQHSSALSHYGGGAHGARANNQHAARRPQYHSYAVRPALYGGHRLYNYRGYARHYPAPRNTYRHQQPQRPYNNGGNRAQRQNRGHGQRQNRYQSRPARHNNNSNNNYQAASKPEHLPSGYTLKPIKALALVPISQGSQYFNGLVHSSNSNNYNHNQASYKGNSQANYNNRGNSNNNNSNGHRAAASNGGY